jgi:hypothetical protein
MQVFLARWWQVVAQETVVIDCRRRALPIFVGNQRQALITTLLEFCAHRLPCLERISTRYHRDFNSFWTDKLRAHQILHLVSMHVASRIPLAVRIGHTIRLPSTFRQRHRG